MRRTTLAVTALTTALTLGATAAPAGAQSVSTGSVDRTWETARGVTDLASPTDDPAFYSAPAGVDLAALAPGAVLRTRTIAYHVESIPTPLTVQQLLYRTTGPVGEPAAAVTSIVQPPGPADGKVMAYESFYDSLNPVDNPSREIAGNRSLGGIIPAVETAFVLPALLAGHRVVIADTEGPTAWFGAGPAYGRASLDALRAARLAPETGIGPRDPIGIHGYSGGAIAAAWAASQVHDYAPELEPALVGVSTGGLLVDPVHNLHYVGPGALWSTIAGLAVVGFARSYRVDLRQYLNERGRAMYDDVGSLSIIEAFARYPSLLWTDIARPEFQDPESAPELKRIIDTVNLGRAPAPSVPMYMAQGAGGTVEGTPGHATLGAGDGIIVTGDVRTFSSRVCATGAPVLYREFGPLSHVPTEVVWAAEGNGWLEGRFRGEPAPSNCGSIPPGNDIG